MKIDCLKNKIQKSVTLAERLTAKNMSLPVLKNILLKTKDGFLYVEATNLEVGVELKVSAKVHEEGLIVINPGVLNGVLSNIKEDKVTLLVEDNQLSIVTESHKTKIKGESAEDFPSLPIIDKLEKIEIRAKDLVLGMKSTIFAASTSDIKPEIASIYIYKENDFLYFVATDSFRLAEKKIKVKNIDNFESIIIPVKNAVELIRIFEETDGDIQVVSDGNQLSVFSEDTHFTSRVIDGVYPDYRQIMPKEFKSSYIVNKEDLLTSLKLNVIFSDKFNQVAFNIKNSESNLIINSSNQEAGENVSMVKIKKANGEKDDFEAYYNIRYLIDAFTIISDKDVFIGHNEVNRPLCIKSDSDESFNYIIMPVSR